MGQKNSILHTIDHETIKVVTIEIKDTIMIVSSIVQGPDHVFKIYIYVYFGIQEY